MKDYKTRGYHEIPLNTVYCTICNNLRIPPSMKQIALTTRKTSNLPDSMYDRIVSWSVKCDPCAASRGTLMYEALNKGRPCNARQARCQIERGPSIRAQSNILG